MQMPILCFACGWKTSVENTGKKSIKSRKSKVFHFGLFFQFHRDFACRDIEKIPKMRKNCVKANGF